jgi:hypothetical protein
MARSVLRTMRRDVVVQAVQAQGLGIALELLVACQPFTGAVNMGGYAALNAPRRVEARAGQPTPGRTTQA